jgi:hypothetical protein
MPGTTSNNGFRYPLATEAPDGPGAILALASDLDASFIVAGTWTPTLGGGSGAAIGANPVVYGNYFRIGKSVQARGRIIFGSSASFGTGAATISGFPAVIDVSRNTSSGYGMFVNGVNTTPVVLQVADGSNMQIRTLVSQAAGSNVSGGYGYALGTPPQSSELRFVLDLTTT